ncbi:hypothetical protein HYQ45_008517 [Verticillium longisporum]|uniref:Uncharacterized protein n=3 Tax=Verticillium TaxID=1036719 RepID=G2XBD1_VERDV|nr:uncharacterized protein VDAG_07269 [Verticillium dahliae VdLs.17]KAF3349325.1 NEDD8-conjugating enzyme UBC12 [Verticillium dahliae VDG2]KAF3356734.1 Thioredoxin [Verticillium dahliae VDG1]KAG7133238.1 hypothetical protein HYQ45_008517 [Verticillium longisporum]KAH6687065.1 hypothetical protein EV126DRAFT_133116 [Verticillium dahliae]EGY16105.1 hypothetical protein VDAG_07269 [Verticillium dahliae VdLs.17]
MAPTQNHEDLKHRTQESARGVYAFSQRQLDRAVSPSTRQQAYTSAADFAHERPLLFAFLVAQLIFSFLPLVIFATFALSTVGFALGAALIFALFWIGVALLVLVPTLFLTSAVGLLVWIWAAGSFVVARKLWQVAPASIKGGQDGSTNGERTGVVLKEEPRD